MDQLPRDLFSRLVSTELGDGLELASIETNEIAFGHEEIRFLNQGIKIQQILESFSAFLINRIYGGGN